MKWRHVKAFIIVRLKSFWRDKADVFWVIMWPIILVVMTAYVFIPPSLGQPMSIDLGVVNYDTSTTPFNGSKLVEILDSIVFNGTKVFNTKIYENETMLVNDLRKGRLDAGIIIPEGFGTNITFGTAKLKILVSGDNPYSIQVNREFMRAFLYEFSRGVSIEKVKIMLQYMSNYTSSYFANQTIEINGRNTTVMEFVKTYFMGIAVPINTTIEEETPETLSERPRILGWYVLGAVGMTLLYTGFVNGATAVVEEKEKGRLERILASPSSEIDMLVGKLLSGLVILLIASIIVILTGLAVGAKITWNPFKPVHWLVIFIFLLIGMITISIGFLLSLVAKTTRSAGNLGTMLGLLLSFTAGIWFPKTWMPKPLQVLADVFPATWGLDAIRSIMVYNAELGEVALLVIKTLLAAIIIMALGILAYKKTLRRYAEI